MVETPGKISVNDLLKYVHDGTYVIPFFQRGFEWVPRMVCELFESILQNYFTGLLLQWELDPEKAANEEWDAIWGAERKNLPKVAILDGQQRLSSLYYAIYNPKKNFPNRQSYYIFYIDITKVINQEYEDSVNYRFYFTNYQSWQTLLKDKEAWAQSGVVPLPILSACDPLDRNKKFIDSVEFSKWLKQYILFNQDNLPPNTSELSIYQILNGILSYSFISYSLAKERDIHDICNIFANVNSKGMRLSTFDLMNAFLYPKNIRLRKDLWENLNNQSLKDVDSNMKEYLLKCISLHKQNYCSAKYLFNLIPGEKIIQRNVNGQSFETVLVDNGSEFKKLWKSSVKYSEKARKIIMNTGISDFGAIKHGFIPNSTIVPVLAAILWRFSDDSDNQDFADYLQKWYWSAVISEDYSGSSDSVMAKDYRDWKEWASNGVNIERINRMTQEYINELDLKQIKKGSARYNAILCMLALNHAKDFLKGRIVGTGDFSYQSINDHHIFPRKVTGLDPSKSLLYRNCKDSIVNRTLLLDETNQYILNKKPSEYIGEICARDTSMKNLKLLLRDHFINELALTFLLVDDFDSFIIEREREIKRKIITKLDLDVTQ